MNPLISAGVDIGWHSIKRTFSVITTLLLIAGLGWAIYAGIIRPVTKPNPTNIQQGQKDNYSVTIAPRSYFGCMKFDIRKPKDINLPKEVKK